MSSSEATQSSIVFGAVASRAVDGTTLGLWSVKFVTHTELKGVDPWWQVDLGANYDISEIKLFKLTAFRRAAEIEPNNPKVHFESGRSYHKFGLQSLAEQELYTLNNLDLKLGNTLSKEIFSP